MTSISCESCIHAKAPSKSCREYYGADKDYLCDYWQDDGFELIAVALDDSGLDVAMFVDKDHFCGKYRGK